MAQVWNSFLFQLRPAVRRLPSRQVVDSIGLRSHTRVDERLSMVIAWASRVLSATLAQAAHDGDIAAVIARLAEGSNPNEADGRGWTPLLYGVLKGDAAMVDALIRGGADVNGAAPDGATPLLKAALWGHTDIVRALLAAGADPGRRDVSGWSALDLAEAGHHAEAAGLLRGTNGGP